MLERLGLNRPSRSERREHIVDVLERERRWQDNYEIAASFGSESPSLRTVARDLRVLERTDVVQVMDADLEFGGPTKYYKLTPPSRPE